MKRVSFNIAKAIKEAGYPQEAEENELSYSEYCSESKIFVLIPYVMEVWLWLWKEKGIYLNIDSKVRNMTGVLIIIDEKAIKFIEREDPEEAIISAIEYLVNNDLIK